MVGDWRELEEPSDRVCLSPGTHQADGDKLGSVIELRMEEENEVGRNIVGFEVSGVEITSGLVCEVALLEVEELVAPEVELAAPEGGLDPLQGSGGGCYPLSLGILRCFPIGMEDGRWKGCKSQELQNVHS